MGFYGNITNTSKTQFQFDRIYPNRLTMENLMNIDNVYFGRYVLVEYDAEVRLDTLTRVYIDNLGRGYTTSNPSPETMIYTNDINYGEIVYTAANYIADAELVPKDCTFWKCTTTHVDGSRNIPAIFEKAVNSDSTYVTNFNIDTAKYGASRGYDSTVWQKVYVDGTEKYVQIAELNSVVPTFDIAADAPTVYPIQPHFDINSTNVYYKLHWQPQWGMRVKEAQTDVTMSQDSQLSYPSDEAVTYTQYTYDPTNGNLSGEPVQYDAAIYYNKEGFQKDRRTYHSNFVDTIQVMPTGISGNVYNVHNNKNGNNTSVQPDIQEFKILLPSLGNTISDIWDIIYGYNTDNNIRFRDIAWKDALDTTEDTNLGGMTRDVNTLAGCINTAHDLLGMIITSKDDSYLNEEGFNQNYIYEENNKYYRIHKYPLYALTQVGNILNQLKDSYPSDQDYNKEYREVIKNVLQDKEYYLITDTSSNNYKAQLLNEKAISALQNTDIIGYQTGDYGYEFIEIVGLPGKMATMYGLILQMKNLLEVEDSETRDTSTVTGAINALNDIIRIFEDLVPGEFLICDSNGHVNSANWTTAQDFKYTNYNTLTPSAEESVFDTKENRWIDLSLDKNNNLITIKHNFNPIDDTTTTANKNDVNSGDEDSINNTDDDTLVLYTPIVDATGHIVGKNLETVTLPYGYKTFKTNGRADNETEVTVEENITNETVASNVQDTMNINSGNYWMRIDITDDNIQLSHSVRDIAVGQDVITNFNEETNANNENNINIPDWTYDNAGHITNKTNHYYTLPFNFKTISTNGCGSGTEANADTELKTDDIVADSTQDTLTIDSGNQWIRINNDNSKNTMTISHDIHELEKVDSLKAISLSSNTSEDVTFAVPVDTYDAAGHILSRNTQSYIMPFGYGKITGDKHADEKSTTTTIEASATCDTLTLTTDDWLTTTVSQDKVTFSHDYPNKDEDTKSSLDMNSAEVSTDDKNKIILETLSYDGTGHITNMNQHTVTLPYGYKTFKDGTAEGAGISSATTTQDTFIFSGDNWIQPTVGQGKVTFTHLDTVAPTEENLATLDTADVTLKFGGEFSVQDWHFDDKGHKNALTTHTITLPSITFDSDNASYDGSNIITDISVDSDDNFVISRDQIINLKLTNYLKNTDDEQQKAILIENSDTLQSALLKLETLITKLETCLYSLKSEDNQTATENTYISSININANDEIEIQRTALPQPDLSDIIKRLEDLESYHKTSTPEEELPEDNTEQPEETPEA